MKMKMRIMKFKVIYKKVLSKKFFLTRERHTQYLCVYTHFLKKVFEI